MDTKLVSYEDGIINTPYACVIFGINIGRHWYPDVTNNPRSIWTEVDLYEMFQETLMLQTGLGILRGGLYS